jgi:hypothetical protein
MPISINGTGSITGISAGGLPSGSVTSDTIANGTIATTDIADGAVTQLKRSEGLTLGTPQNSTSGTSIDFTGIPSWVKRITVMFNGVSTNGTSRVQVQLGTSSGTTTTGYLVNSSSIGAGGTVSTDAGATSGFTATTTQQTSANNALAGNIFISLFGSNIWIGSGVISSGSVGGTNYLSGSVTLSGTLDRIRITTVNGTDQFDAGSINIMYE